ncbi:hypothetical protein MRX96_023636 [Rhipicephalus microplus]
MPRLDGSSSSIVGVVDYINRITAKETKMAATAERLATLCNWRVSRPLMPPIRVFAGVAAAVPQRWLDKSSRGFNYPVCYTPSCVLLGKRLRAMLNPLVDPCDNFNEHVCGRYEGASFSILEDYDGILQAVREL